MFFHLHIGNRMEALNGIRVNWCMLDFDWN